MINEKAAQAAIKIFFKNWISFMFQLPCSSFQKKNNKNVTQIPIFPRAFSIDSVARTPNFLSIVIKIYFEGF